jgi:hypothetical protein
VIGATGRGATGATGLVGPTGATGAVSGAFPLDTLTDVEIADLAQGDLLAYNQAISKWVNISQNTVTDGGNF